MRYGLCILSNVIILVMVVYAVRLMMVFTAERLRQDGTVEGGALMTAGLRNLRFFTALSNILEGAACLALLIALAVNKAAGAAGTVPFWAAELKLAAASSVALTFITVMVFLGPSIGYKVLFTGANLWFHGIIPIAAMLEFAFIDGFEGFPELPLGAAFIAVIPMILYGICYLINVLRGGMEDGKYVNDWYGFAKWGIPASFLVFAAAAAVTLIMALLLRWGSLDLR